MTSYTFSQGRTHLLRLEYGADVYDEITSYARKNFVRTATISCLGELQRASLRYYDQDRQAYLDRSIEQRLSVVAGVGNVSLVAGDPFVHLHMVLADEEGVTVGGHVNKGTTVFALEVSITELEGDPPVRTHDDCTGLALWGGTLEAEC